MSKKITNPTRGQIRYLLKRHNGRCAITGEKLDPRRVSPDHIIPISRKDLSEEKLYGKVWLVWRDVNRMKLALTIDEFYNVIEKIYMNKNNALKLFEEFKTLDKIPEMPKKEFDDYVEKNIDEDGIIKD